MKTNETKITGKKFAKVFKEARKRCKKEMGMYTGCISTNITEISKDVCVKEFSALKTCFFSLK